MTNENVSTPGKETFTWLEPGAWRKPCIVHVTMVANARQALFGTLTHNGSEAVIEKTPIGWALISQQRRMLELCPEVKILADKVMPDHHHMVLQVQRTMLRSIKEVVRGYMQGCKAEARKLGFFENLYDAPPFYRVLTHKGQLHAMIEYVKPGGVYFEACSRGQLLLMEPDGSAFVNPVVMKATEEALRRKAEAKHYSYRPIPVESQRYRFVALNEIGQLLVER